MSRALWCYAGIKKRGLPLLQPLFLGAWEAGEWTLKQHCGKTSHFHSFAYQQKWRKREPILTSTSHAELISLVEDSLHLELWMPRCMENTVPHFPTSPPEGGWNEGRVSPSTHHSHVLNIPFQGPCCGLHTNLDHSNPGDKCSFSWWGSRAFEVAMSWVTE